MPRNRMPAEILMHEPSPRSSPCGPPGFSSAFEAANPVMRCRARRSLGCRGLRIINEQASYHRRGSQGS